MPRPGNQSIDDDGQQRQRDMQGRFVGDQGNQPSQGGQNAEDTQYITDNLRKNPDGQIEWRVKVDGEEQWVPEGDAREKIQKGQHYTQNMQRVREMEKQLRSQAGDQGLQRGVDGTDGQSALGSGSQPSPGDQPQRASQQSPALDIDDPPDPLEEPEKYKEFMRKQNQELQRTRQEVEQMRSRVEKVSNKTADQEEHEALSAEYPDYDPQEVEDELTRMRHENPQRYKEIGSGQSKPSKELVHLRIRQRRQNQQQSQQPQGQTEQQAQKGQTQRMTPHAESQSNAPPSEEENNAPQNPTTPEEKQRWYMEQNRKRSLG